VFYATCQGCKFSETYDIGVKTGSECYNSIYNKK
jgi:hypothetical protein